MPGPRPRSPPTRPARPRSTKQAPAHVKAQSRRYITHHPNPNSSTPRSRRVAPRPPPRLCWRAPSLTRTSRRSPPGHSLPRSLPLARPLLPPSRRRPPSVAASSLLPPARIMAERPSQRSAAQIHAEAEWIYGGATRIQAGPERILGVVAHLWWHRAGRHGLPLAGAGGGVPRRRILPLPRALWRIWPRSTSSGGGSSLSLELGDGSIQGAPLAAANPPSPLSSAADLAEEHLQRLLQADLRPWWPDPWARWPLLAACSSMASTTAAASVLHVLRGWGSPRGLNPRAGTGMGKKCSP